MRQALAKKNGPPNADLEFGAMLSSEAGRLASYARRLAGNAADADDLFQETMLRCWAARRSFQPDTNFVGWTRAVMSPVNMQLSLIGGKLVMTRSSAAIPAPHPCYGSSRFSVSATRITACELASSPRFFPLSWKDSQLSGCKYRRSECARGEVSNRRNQPCRRLIIESCRAYRQPARGQTRLHCA